jgi:uncharacterized protein
MSDRRAHVLYAVVGAALAVALALGTDAEVALSLSEGLWFELLIFVVIAAFLMEPNYSGGQAAAANSVAVFFISISVDRTPHDDWWSALMLLSIAGFSLSLLGYVLRDPGTPKEASKNRGARASTQLAGVLGSWRSVLLACLALTLATFNTPFGDEWRISLVVTLFCLFASRVQPHRIVAAMRGVSPLDADGVVADVYPPFEAVVLATGDGFAPPVGSVLRISGSRGDALALVTAEVSHRGARAWRTYVPDLGSALPDGSAGDRDLQVAPAVDDVGLAEEREELQTPGTALLGTLTEGTAIRSAVVELLPSAETELGSVVWTRRGPSRTLWQVADATLERTAWSGDTRRSTRVHATQIGQWRDDLCAFVADTRSPTPASVVFAGELVAPQLDDLPPNSLRIGSLPTSPFPVYIDLAQLSRTHAAILGTTGTGKTHLAFALAEALQNLGVKIICVDLTGQYQQRFPKAVAASSASAVRTFLEGDDWVAICSPAHGTAINTANAVARTAYDWAAAQGAPSPGAPARCVVLLEEAQNFIPEAFVVNDWDLKAKAQDTSLVVMESRKFGVGFIVVSQRTAMVTKSALSQCNTVFAFQAVDHTGLDYLEGLCGPTLIRGVPTLPHRTAIVMGSALRSAAPLITHLDDARVVIP